MKETAGTTQSHTRLNTVGAFLLHIVRHNIGYKVLALLIAVLLWAALITQDPTLTRVKIFTDVSVTVSGMDTLKRNGYIVTSDLDELLNDVTVRASVPQSKYDDAVVNAYSIRVDLSRLSGSGEAELKLQSSASTTYGSVTEIIPASVTVQLEEYITRYRIPVVVTTEGSVPEGYYTGSATVSPAVITVSGPRSLVENIARARVIFDLSTICTVEGTERDAISFRLEDRKGNVIESDLISVTSEGVLLDTVIVEHDVYPTATVPLSGENLVTGTPGAGYEVKSVTYTPESITVAASTENISQLDTLLSSASVDISGASETVVRTISIRKPSELVNITPGSVTVTVEIGPISKTRTLTNLKINVDGCPTNLRASANLSTVKAEITGPMLWVNDLKNTAIRISCDATGLEPGTYELPLTCVIDTAELPEHTVTLSPDVVKVTIK